MLGIPTLPTRAFIKEGGQIKPQGGGSAPSAPSSQTVTQTNIPEYARPYAEEMLGQGQALTDINQNPYTPYEGQRFAGFSPMQAQAFQNVAGQQVAPQLTDASNIAYTGAEQGLGAQQTAQGLQQAATGYGQVGAQYGALGAGMAPQALQYGAQGSGIGGIGVQQAQQGFGAGQQYAQQATSPEAMQAYMSPYMQNVVDTQTREARRQSAIDQQGIQSQAAQQGAFGGSRSAILEAERQRNLGTQLGDIQARGSQQAFQQAQQAQQFGAGLGIQGLQAGYQGLDVGLKGAESGLRGIQTGLQGTAQGIKGAQAGLQGVGQATDAARYGLSGAEVGIRGAGQLGQLGGQQFDQEMNITDAMQKYGSLQQQQAQQDRDFQYQQFLAQQQYPYQQLSYMSDLLRGVPSSQSAQLNYEQPPDQTAQLIGSGLAAYGAYNRKEGGQVKKYQAGGQVSADAMSTMAVQEMPSRLRRLSDAQLAAYARNVKDAITLSAIQSEMTRRARTRMPQGDVPEVTTAEGIAKQAEAAALPQGAVGMYGGGIVALQEGGALAEAQKAYDKSKQELMRFSIADQRQRADEYQALQQQNKIDAERLRDLQPQPAPRQTSIPQFGNLREQVQSEIAQGQTGAFQTEPPEVQALPPDPTMIPPAGMSSAVGIGGVSEQRRQENEQATPPAPQAGAATAPAPAVAPSTMTFDQWRGVSAQATENPEDQAILADMKARVESRMARAEEQEDTAKYDAILTAGLAMMSGTSLADGIARAAQTGGAQFMASKDKAAEAINAAEDAELSFNKYKMELRKGDEAAAQSAFESYMNYSAKMQQIGVTREVGMARAARSGGLDAKDIASMVSGDPKVKAALKGIDAANKELNPERKAEALRAANANLERVMREVRAGIISGDSPSAPESTANPMPTSKDQLKSGAVYDTPRGPARWNGERFELVQ
jgi:hypothetical protein